MSREFIGWLRRQIDEDEVYAVAASQTREPGIPTGEHWRWQCSHCDAEIKPDIGIDEYLFCSTCRGFGMALRSVEQYDTSSIGPLPAFILDTEDVTTPVAGYLLRCEPARMLREVAVKRRLVDEILNYEAQLDGEPGCSHNALRALAEVYRGRPGWRDEWQYEAERPRVGHPCRAAAPELGEASRC